jgi:hypothetical protein
MWERDVPERNHYYDQQVLTRAQRIGEAAIRDFLAAGDNEAVVVPAPAGAGKTQFVVETVGAVRRRRRILRMAVGTPTNEQAFALVRRLAESHTRETITLVPASTVVVPSAIAVLPNVQQLKAAQANGEAIIVGTLSKLGDAFSRGDLFPVDRLIVDESFQADSSRYFGVAGLAPTHLLVGDSGQLSPFSTIADADYWRGLPEDPLQTAVGVLLRNHPTTPVHKLPVSRRLDARAVAVAQAFYSDLPFEAAVLPGVRELRLMPAIAGSRRAKLIDHVLDRAATDGWVHLELPAAPVLTADPEIVEFICDLVARLAQRRPRLRCDLTPNWTELAPRRIAVGVAHNDQKDILRARLATMGHSGVTVDTANKLQGLEFDFVIAWHPLAGLADPDAFHLEPGRLCVLLTRHRHACVVIGRASDRALLDAIPPATPAYLGWDPDPLFDGWGVHESVFRALEPYRIAA